MPSLHRFTGIFIAIGFGWTGVSLSAQTKAPAGKRDQPPCPNCAEWNAPAKPVRLFGNVYYVGTGGLSAVLLTSSQGHILLDGGLPESAARIETSMRTLGFRVEDIKLIVNSHAHYDHAGGIAALRRASGAVVAASPGSAPVLRRGASGPDDPQYGLVSPFPAIGTVKVIADGDTLRVGPIAVTAHFTPGHTPGGTSWTWRSCEEAKCLDFVYADSQTPVSADNFSFTRNATYPTALGDFAHGLAVIERLPCDVLITPHPGASDFGERLAARQRGDSGATRSPESCRRYAGAARRAVDRRVTAETLPRRATRGNLTIEFADADSAVAAGVGDMLAPGAAAIERFLDGPFPHRFAVRIFPGRASLTSHWAAAWGVPDLKAECWMVASGVADELAILSPRAWSSEACEHSVADTAGTRRVLWHELVHVYHGQHNPHPDFDGMDDLGWFVEGLAVVASGQLDAEHRDDARQAIAASQGPTALANAWSGRWRYGVAGSLVGYVDRTWGRATVRAMLADTTQAGLLARLGVTEAALIARWRDAQSR